MLRLSSSLIVAGLISSAVLAAEAVPAPDGSFVGQIVCAGCWHEAPRPQVAYGTPEDLECAVRCARDGIAQALAVRAGDGFELLELASPSPAGGAWLDEVSRFVRVWGEVTPGDERWRLRVQRVEPAEPPAWAQAAGKVAASPPADAAAERMELRDLTGHPVPLTRYRGAPVVVNFWATWCKPCVEELPQLARVHRTFAPYGVTFVGAAAEPLEAREGLLAAARRAGTAYPILVGATLEHMQALGLPPALPGTVILDGEGRVVETYPGVIDPSKLERRLSAIVGLEVGAADEPPARAHAHGHAHGAPSRRRGEGSLVPS